MDPLQYHRFPIPGKIEVIPTKKCISQQDLSMAYSPGVAEPCMEIQKDPMAVHYYTNRSNLVAVITNGTAVLGLGNIGPLAGKPVMEGKGVLFKRFADVDVFDIELSCNDPDQLVETIAMLEPTFGGINLEDIRAPECFYIETELKKRMSIPVFHDDQHGTAIITAAALLNALEITGRKIGDVKVVVNGSGASGIACSKLYVSMGVKQDNIVLCDSKGVIYRGRGHGMNPYKEDFAVETKDRTLGDAIKGADLFLGLSVGDALTPEMLKTMNDNPIVFALANPDPEIRPDIALETRKDVIIATGRSDYPNQVNNVLGFPFIFRGALDVQASDINEPMKIAASKALADLAKKEVPDDVKRAYNSEGMTFGKEYLIPKPFDSRVFFEVSLAVAEAAVASGVAGIKDFDKQLFREDLEKRFHERIIRFNNMS